jgi:hypothetical protein
MSWKTSSLLLLLLVTLPVGVARAQPTFSTSATATPQQVSAGSAVTLTTNVTGSQSISVRVLVQVYDPSYNLVHSTTFENQALTAGQGHSNSTTWTVPGSEPQGRHTIMVGIYSPDASWSTEYHFNGNAGQFTVGTLPYTSSATVSPNTATAGESIGITATVTSATSETALIDVEVYDSSGTKAFQRYFDNQTLVAGQPLSISMYWHVPESASPDVYTVKIGIFGPGWTSSKHWNSNAAQLSLGALDYRGSASAQPTAVSDGSTLAIATSLTSIDATSVLVRVRVMNPSGSEVHSQTFTNQTFAAGETRNFSVLWTVPAGLPVGYYQVILSVHSLDGATQYYRRTELARFTVGRRPAPHPSLPSYLTIGASAPLDEVQGVLRWMPDTGIPFNYAFWYLAGGVQPGQGWAYWGAGNGQWVTEYTQAADQGGFVPLFTYYQLFQSAAPCSGCGEKGTDLTTLNDSQKMAAYYQDFIVLMKRLGPATHDGISGFGKKAIVHIEPDLSGYAMQAVNNAALCHGYCTGVGNHPALLNASVASSGVPELTGYPNTYQGFNQALLHLRDLYAPNVLLAFHISLWGVTHDASSSSAADLDAWGLGHEAGTFAALSGVIQTAPNTSTYDLIFNDVIDRDAWYQENVEQAPAGAWWDTTNQTFPNFHRWEQFLSGALQVAPKPAMVWQIPLGNQYFQTMDNTPHHYQDNRIQYFFDHIEEVARLGVIGLSFNPGLHGQTANWDAKGDGVYNSTCSSGGSPPPPHCSWQPSTVADDDGGYLRMRAQQYYQSPFLL